MENPAPKGSVGKKVGSFVGKNKKPLIILAVVVLVGLLFYGTYKVGYNKGYKVGKKSAQPASSAIDSFLKNPTSPFKTVSGEIKAVSASEITINSSKGEVKKIKLTSNTKITQKTTTLKATDLKAGQKVTIFTDNKDGDTATRVVLRAKQ